MRNLWKSIILATGVIALGGAAMAADVVRPPPVVAKPIIVAPRAFSWAGPYIGIQGGYDTNNARTLAPAPAATASINGFIAGVYGGVNLQPNPGGLVWGIDASINWDNASGPVVGFGGFTGEVDWKAFVRGRVGLPVGAAALIYGTLGGTWANLKCVPGCGNDTAGGWTAGLGVDFALGGNGLVARLDWAYSNYGTFNEGPPAFNATMNSNTFMVGIAKKF
jgi:outer membrane immunogenic protein